MLPFGLLLAMGFVSSIDGVLMSKAKLDPGRYIKYDDSPQSLLLDLSIVLFTMYSMLAAMWASINLIFKIRGHQHTKRSYS